MRCSVLFAECPIQYLQHESDKVTRNENNKFILPVPECNNLGVATMCECLVNEQRKREGTHVAYMMIPSGMRCSRKQVCFARTRRLVRCPCPRLLQTIGWIDRPALLASVQRDLRQSSTLHALATSSHMMMLVNQLFCAQCKFCYT